jgi:hypothetical protein
MSILFNENNVPHFLQFRDNSLSWVDYIDAEEVEWEFSFSN